MGQLYGANVTPSQRLDAMLFRLRQRFATLIAPISTPNVWHTPHAPAVDSLALAATRVLVVDDEPVQQLITRARLAEFGITPIQAVDGAEAVALACELPFDFILMDLQMPVLDGLTATQQIRQFEQEHRRPRVPVIAYSTSCYSEAFMRDFGIDGLLEKPCSSVTLRESLLTWCPA